MVASRRRRVDAGRVEPGVVAKVKRDLSDRPCGNPDNRSGPGGAEWWRSPAFRAAADAVDGSDAAGFALRHSVEYARDDQIVLHLVRRMLDLQALEAGLRDHIPAR